MRSNVGIERGSAAQVFALDGSSAAPSISFASDPDTGFYWVGANTFSAVVGGSLVATFSSGGIRSDRGTVYAPAGSSLFIEGSIADAGAAIGVKVGNVNSLTAGTDRFISVFYNDSGTTARAWVCTDGTGIFSNLKFGTYNATGDVACNGYVSITDYGGTTRKLMTCA